MFNKSFHHNLPSGERAKFTIREKIINGKLYYIANVINIDIESYKNLSESRKEMFYGTEVTDGNQQTVFYSSAEKLANDIRQYYELKWLVSEI